MTDDRNTEHAENIQLLSDLCDAIFPAGSYPVDFGPDKPPAIAYHFEGATGVALPMFHININEPVIRELARRAIETRAGGELIQPATVHIGAKIEIDRNHSKPKLPYFIDAVAWYNGLKDGFKKVGYSDVTIVDGLWQYINRDMTFFLSFFESFYRLKHKPTAGGLVRISQKLEKNKVYISEIGKQLSLDLDEDKLQIIEKENIDIIGMDLDVSEDNCLFAIQTLLSDNDYKPTWTEEKTGKTGFAFTTTAYLDACRVPKPVNKYGKKEYDRNGRRAALTALEKISRRSFIIAYDTKKDKDGNRYRMKSIVRLWTLHILEKVTKTGQSYVQGYAITDYAETLELDIKNYFLLKPRDYKEQIRKIAGRRHTRGCDRFINEILISANEKRRLERRGQSPAWEIEFRHTTIFNRPEFRVYSRNRHYDDIWQQWRFYCELGIKMGYILTVKTAAGRREKKEIITLNREKFSELWRDLQTEKDQSKSIV